MAVRRGLKVYVDVCAFFSDEGELMPRYLIWEDGTRYDIDMVKSIERCASRKAGGAGILYTCRINGQYMKLYYEENNRWFVESKK
ncbi:MAG: hypothetical protein K5877_06700 [Lachnospiraceae bacterium]|nr:hypothetical protein [Lachnospiraceae bacterium]